MKILFREHRGLLEDSMKTCREVSDLSNLTDVVNDLYGQGEVTVQSYVYDNRIGWDTQMVCLKGNAVGFTSGVFETRA